MKKGQVYNIDGKKYCVLFATKLEEKKYVLFSIEDEKIDYKFYEYYPEGNSYGFKIVDNELLESFLFEEYLKIKEDEQ